VLGAVVLFVGGLLALGNLALDSLRDRERYTVPLAEVECEPPPGHTRERFLDEVQYTARLPDRLHLLEEDLLKRLADAFALHPWVEKVERVEVTPPRRVQVRVVYRRPALAVSDGEQLRAVDREGILLPRGAPTEGLPVYEGEPPPPAGPAGARWGDAAVEGAARRAANKSKGS
jgi:hypothetical protein